MKRSAKRITASFLLTCLLSSMCSVFSIAAYYPPDDSESSEYLSSYSVAAVAESDGIIAVTVDVTAVVNASEIGATDIYIYEGNSSNGIFTCVAHYSSDDNSNMLGTGYFYYRTAVRHQGTIGKYYFANVYVYAGNSTGGDTRIEPTNTVVAHT